MAFRIQNWPYDLYMTLQPGHIFWRKHQSCWTLNSCFVLLRTHYHQSCWTLNSCFVLLRTHYQKQIIWKVKEKYINFIWNFPSAHENSLHGIFMEFSKLMNCHEFYMKLTLIPMKSYIIVFSWDFLSLWIVHEIHACMKNKDFLRPQKVFEKTMKIIS